MTDYDKLDAWVNAHFDEEVRFLQELIRVPTDTPPGNNAPHAERTAELLQAFGFEAEKYPVPAAEVQAYGLESIINLIVRRRLQLRGRDGPQRLPADGSHGARKNGPCRHSRHRRRCAAGRGADAERAVPPHDPGRKPGAV